MYSLFLFAVLYLSLGTPSRAQNRKRMLVLGGDGMLGSETVARLKLRGHDITILHRGKWYWDSSIRIKPWVNFVQCDRDRFNMCADQLGDITREKGMFDAVIDFSGYRPSQIKVNMKQSLFVLNSLLHNLTLSWSRVRSHRLKYQALTILKIFLPSRLIARVGSTVGSISINVSYIHILTKLQDIDCVKHN